MKKNGNEREYQCKKYERKNTVSRQYARENIYEVPWMVARARVPRQDAVGQRGGEPRRPLETTQFWEILEREQ